MVIITAGLFLGCEQRKDEARERTSFAGLNQASLFTPETYPSLHTFLGEMTVDDLMQTLGDSMDILNANQRQGLTTTADYRSILAMIANTRNYLADTAPGAAETPLMQSLAALFTLLAGNDPAYPAAGIGATLDKIIRRLGPDFLTHDLAAMLDFLVQLESATPAASAAANALVDHHDDFHTLMGVIAAAGDPAGRYAALYDSLGSITSEVAAIEGSTICLADLQALLDNLRDLDLGAGGLLPDETEDRLDRTMAAGSLILQGRSARVGRAHVEAALELLADLLEEEPAAQDAGFDQEVLSSTLSEVLQLFADTPGARQALQALLFSAAGLMHNTMPSDGHHAWDSAATTDIDRLLHCLRDLLEGTDRAALEDFVDAALAGAAPVVDVETIAGLLQAIAAGGPYPAGLGRALWRDMIRYNMYGQDRATASVKTSSLRALIFLMQHADTSPGFNYGLSSLDILPLIFSSNGSTVSRSNMARWTIGEIVSELDRRPDIYSSFDWVLYRKDYHAVFPLSLFLGHYDGLVGMLANGKVRTLLDNPAVVTAFPALVALAGGDGSYGTAGTRHRLFSLFAPLMQYFWQERREADLIGMLKSLNEIDRFNGLSTFTSDNQGQVLKAVEGPDGYGLLTYALRGHVTGDEGVFDPLVALLSQLAATLSAAPHPAGYAPAGYTGDSLLEALLFECGLDSVDLGSAQARRDILEALFATGDGLGDKVATFLAGASQRPGVSNHDLLVDLCRQAGSLLQAAEGLLLAAEGLDPLVGYATGEHLWGALQTAWDDGATLECLRQDGATVSRCLRSIAGADGAGDLAGSLRTILQDLAQPAPPDIAERPLSMLLRHILTPLDDPSWNYNPLIDTLMSITCRALDLYDETYNPAATGSPSGIAPTTPLTCAVARLVDYYDLATIRNVLQALSSKTATDDLLLWQLLEALADLGDRITGQSGLPVELARSLFIEQTGSGSIVAIILARPDLAAVIDNRVTMPAVLDELDDLFSDLDLVPDSRAQRILLDTLDFLLQNGTVH